MALVDGLTVKIATALGLSLLAVPTGCVDRAIDADDLGGDGSAEDGSEGSATTGMTTNVSTTSTSTSTSTTTPTITATATIGEEGSADSGPVPVCVPSDEWLEWEMWWPPTPEGSCVCDEACQAEALAQWNEENCCGSCWYAFGDVLCSEPIDGLCHYIVTMWEEGCGKGRPLFVDGEACTADPLPRDDWAEGASPRLAGLDEHARQWLAARWARAALAEHASVASFARFVLDLAAMGAPPSLLSDATSAMQDEIRHAQVAFALASAYAGTPVGPGPLAMDGVTAGGEAEAIVRAAVREGCVEETLAAAEAELAAHRATDPAVRAALLAIAEDEARHAVLAWRFVDWALSQDASLLPVVHDEIARAAHAVSTTEISEPDERAIDAELASAHGMLPPDMRHGLRQRCLSHTIRPCAAAMLHARSRGASPVA